jgi:hypothetical protein
MTALHSARYVFLVLLMLFALITLLLVTRKS